MKNVIEVKNLHKRYDSFELGPIDLELPSGEIVGLIGENGAGKTTLIKLLLGIIFQDSGEIKLFERSSESDPLVKNDIGVVLDNMFFPEILTPADINSIMKDLYKTWDEQLYMKYINDFKIPIAKPLKTFSKGMRKKTEIAAALAHHPKLLILDEPTTGLDPVVRNEVLDIFRDFIDDENHSILLSTHITTDLEHIADRIVFIDKGKIVLNESHDGIMDEYGILKCDIDDFDKITTEDKIAVIKNRYNYDILIKDISKMKKKYKNYIIDKITLEDLMLLMIKGEKR